MVRRASRPWRRWTLASSQICTNGICVAEMAQLTDGLSFKPGRTYAWRVRADGVISSEIVRFRVPERDLSNTDERSTPGSWATKLISDATNSLQWSPAENNAVVSARGAVATMFQRFTQWPQDSNAEVFNRVMVNSDLAQRILLVRANIPNVNGVAPTINVIDPVTGANYYNVVRNGNCAASDGTGSLWPLPPTKPAPKMIICNGTFTVSAYTMVHEFGHLFDYASNNYNSTDALSLNERVELTDFNATTGEYASLYDCEGDVVLGYVPFTGLWSRGERGWGSGPRRKPDGSALLSNFQQNSDNNYTEAAADMFLNYVYRSNQAGGRGDVACTNPVAWNGPAFLNQSWLDMNGIPTTSNTPTSGTPDPRLPGHLRQKRTHTWIRNIFNQHLNW